jgi:glucodextranase-like protein/PASTA domain-containing protein
MRLAPFLLLAAIAAGCGGEDRVPADPPAVRLAVDAPADSSVVREDTVELRGRVSPGASVRVLGHRATVTGGAFTASVALEQGVNVIDVAATMAGRSTALKALRVTFDPRVDVPDLAGTDADEAVQQLSDLGLSPSVDHVGGIFDDLRSGPRRVCDSEPEPGTRVQPQTEVRLRVAKAC